MKAIGTYFSAVAPTITSMWVGAFLHERRQNLPYFAQPFVPKTLTTVTSIRSPYSRNSDFVESCVSRAQAV